MRCYYTTRTFKLILFILLFVQSTIVKGQLVYFTATTGQGSFNGQEQIWVMNLATCEYCPVSNFTVASAAWMFILPNGDLMLQENTGAIIRYSVPDLTPVWTTSTSFYYSNPYTHPNGNIYMAGNNMLFIFNPANNTFTTVGNFPAGTNIAALFWYNGSLHGAGSNGYYQIPVGNPGNTTLVGPLNIHISSLISTASGTVLMSWIGGGTQPQTDFGIYNVATTMITPICPTPLNSVGALAEILPPNVPMQCVCLPSSAGAPTTNTAYTVCAPGPADITTLFDANVNLDFNDGVNYILYSNPNDITGSVLAQNNTGIFPFLPSYVFGATYYVARIVGNITNNVVNLGDPCLDISLPIPLIWREKPTVISLTSDPNVCDGGCEDVTLSIQGTPPFGYGWQWQQNGNPIGYFYQLNLSSSPITFQACPPASASGPLQLVICSITDAYCSNP
jgi:hypothetical protein